MAAPDVRNASIQTLEAHARQNGYTITVDQTMTKVTVSVVSDKKNKFTGIYENSARYVQEPVQCYQYALRDAIKQMLAFVHRLD